MGKIRTLKTAFVSGELAQQVFGRIDKDFYLKGADKLRNVYVDPLGGVYKREGMRYIDETYGSGKAKIVEFAFNTEQTYLIVFTHQRIRVYREDAMVADISNNTVLNNITSDNLSDIKYVQAADYLIIVNENFPPIKIVRNSHVSWSISEIAFEDKPLYAFNGTTKLTPNVRILLSNTIGKGVTVETMTLDKFTGFVPGRNWIVDEYLAKVGMDGPASTSYCNGLVIKGYNGGEYTAIFSESGVMRIDTGFVSESFPQANLSAGSWYAYDPSTGKSIYPNADINIADYIIKPGYVGSISQKFVSLVVTRVYDGANFFQPSYVDSYLTGALGGLLRITEYISPTKVIGDIYIEFPGDAVSSVDPNSLTYESGEWFLETGYEPAWSSTRGYPKTVCFYQGRLWFGGSKTIPSTLWGSCSGKFFNFGTGSGNADEAIDVTIDDDRINAIVNIFPGRNLQIFTTGGEFYIPQTEADPIKPENIMVQKSTQHGSSTVRPVSVDGGTIFIETSGRVIRQFLFNEIERSYNAQSISLLSSQLIRNPVAMAVRQSREESPADYVYVVNSDGSIAVLNVLRNEQLLAWSLFETKGVVEDLVVVVREVYLITKRTINGVDKRFIEKLDKEYFLDAGKKATSSTAVLSFSGFNHLTLEEVKARAGSFVLLDNRVKANGSIDIELDYKEIEVGLGFSVLVRTLPIDMDLGGKTLTGDWRRVIYAMVKTFNSRSFEVRCGRNTFRPVFRSLGSNLLDAEIEPYNGWKKIYMSGGIKRDAAFDIVQDEPTEFDLISMVIAITI